MPCVPCLNSPRRPALWRNVLLRLPSILQTKHSQRRYSTLQGYGLLQDYLRAKKTVSLVQISSLHQVRFGCCGDIIYYRYFFSFLPTLSFQYWNEEAACSYRSWQESEVQETYSEEKGRAKTLLYGKPSHFTSNAPTRENKSS